MKWFKHNTDSHTNAKLRLLIRKFGMKGYGFYWLINEIIGKEGEKFRLKAEKEWKILLREASLLDDKESNSLLDYIGQIKGICHKSLEKGELYNPKLRERADTYSKRVRRVFEHCSNNVPLEENRIDKKRIEEIRREYIKAKKWDGLQLTPNDFSRIGGGIKKLIRRAGNDQLVIAAIGWVAAQNYCDWTLETVLKKFPDFLKNHEKSKALKEMEAVYKRSIQT